MAQVRTYQLRLPQGPHEAVLDAWGALAGRAMRTLHVRLRRAESEAAGDAEKLRTAKNAIKTAMISDFGISGRQYNGIAAALAGAVDSRIACAARDVERLEQKILAKEKALAGREKRLAGDRKARAAHAAKVSEAMAKRRPAPQPTRSQATAILDPEARAKLRFDVHQRRRGLGALRARLVAAKDVAGGKRPPRMVFGGLDLFQAGNAVHANDIEGREAWRRKWQAARAKGFMLIGGKDEAAGNKSCKFRLDDRTGKAGLELRLPDGLRRALGIEARHLSVAGLALPGFGGAVLRDAIARNRVPGERIALTFRFVRDPETGKDGFRNKDLSAWRVCITIDEEMPELRQDIPAKPGLPGRRLGVDVNADHLATTLIDAFGNPVGSWTVPLCLRGLSAGVRDARVGDAVKAVVELARAHDARIVLEALDFAKKKREIAQEAARSTGERAHRRMLSSLAYAAILDGIVRSARRHAIPAGFVNPAYTSLIGETNLSRRYGLTRHQAAAAAIARRDAGFSERINHVRGLRRRRTTLPAPEEARRHVWRHWAQIHRERHAAAAAARRAPAHPPGRRETPGPAGRETVAADLS